VRGLLLFRRGIVRRSVSWHWLFFFSGPRTQSFSA
jgi:hypothetical protein